MGTRSWVSEGRKLLMCGTPSFALSWVPTVCLDTSRHWVILCWVHRWVFKLPYANVYGCPLCLETSPSPSSMCVHAGKPVVTLLWEIWYQHMKIQYLPPDRTTDTKMNETGTNSHVFSLNWLLWSIYPSPRSKGQKAGFDGRFGANTQMRFYELPKHFRKGILLREGNSSTWYPWQQVGKGWGQSVRALKSRVRGVGFFCTESFLHKGRP
jgi:hypothetical protein